MSNILKGEGIQGFEFKAGLKLIKLNASKRPPCHDSGCAIIVDCDKDTVAGSH